MTERTTDMVSTNWTLLAAVFAMGFGWGGMCWYFVVRKFGDGDNQSGKHDYEKQ